MSESSIERAACRRIAAELGVENLKLNVKGNTGWPDRIFFLPGGRPLLVEFKRPGERSRPKQMYIISQLIANGYDAEVCSDAGVAVELVRERMKWTTCRSTSKHGHGRRASIKKNQ